MQKDNWGWRARIGMFIVGNEAVPEAEWWAMAPPGVSVHAARITASAPWARWSADRTKAWRLETLEKWFKSRRGRSGATAPPRKKSGLSQGTGRILRRLWLFQYAILSE